MSFKWIPLTKKKEKEKQWSSGVTDLSLLIFKHGDGWARKEGAERVDRRGEGMTKWQKRASCGGKRV